MFKWFKWLRGKQHQDKAFTEMIDATIKARSEDIHQNILDHNVLFRRLIEMNKKEQDKKENFRQLLNAMQRAAEDNECMRDNMLAAGNNAAEFPEQDALHIRAGIEFLNGLEEQLLELWNNGWAKGQSDHAVHMRGRENSEWLRNHQVEKILEIKL